MPRTHLQYLTDELNKLRQQRERFLPAQAACLGRDDVRHAFLHDVQLRANEDALECDRRSHLSWQVRSFDAGRNDMDVKRISIGVAAIAYWDERRESGYLLVLPPARERGELKFDVRWD